MRVDAAQDELALFMHQMIPHHANAVNMAKYLVKEGDARRASDPHYLSRELKDMLYNIVNSQNYQIHQMEAYLSDLNNPPVSPMGDANEEVPLAVRDAVSYSIDGQPTTERNYRTRFM